MLSGSLRTQSDFLNHPLGFPTSPRLNAYHTAINNHFPQWLLNSLILTIASVVITLVFASLAAWGLSRWHFVGRDLLLSLIISLMVIPPVVLVVPLFLLGAELNLIDTRRIVIAIYVGLMMPFSVYMLAAYFRTIPRSLIEAAEIDGASSLQVFLRVVVPLSGAPLITLAVVNALWVWNELLIALVFLQSQDSLTLMAGLTGFQNRYNLEHPRGDGRPLDRDPADLRALHLRPALLHARTGGGRDQGRVTGGGAAAPDRRDRRRRRRAGGDRAGHPRARGRLRR